MPNTLTVELPPGVAPENARLLLSLKLFEEGEVSLGRAAALAGYSKAAYRKLLGERGVPAFGYTVEEFEDELATLEELRQEVKTKRHTPPSEHS